MLRRCPVGLRLIIIIDAAVIVAVPVPIGALAVLRRLFELVLGEIGPISAERSLKDEGARIAEPQ